VPVGDYRIDLFVEGTVVVEVKSSDRLEPVFIAQVLTYLRAVGCRVGLIFNFNVSCLKNGLRRVIVRDADPSPDPMSQSPPVGVERNSR
jgi:GxxExxY protein